MQRWKPEIFNMFACPHDWQRYVSSGELFEAHNAFFEWCMYNNILVPRYGWPVIPLENWRCSMAVCCFNAMPRSLEGAGAALGLAVQKDKVGSRVMLQLCKPRKPSKNNPDLYFSDPEKFKILDDYCGTDVETQGGISAELGELPEGELLTWRVDQMINKRGVKCDYEAIEGALEILDLAMVEYKDQLAHLTKTDLYPEGVVTTPNQHKKLAEWLEWRGFYFDNLQAKTVKDAIADGGMMQSFMRSTKDDRGGLTSLSHGMEMVEFPDDVLEVLKIRQSASKSSTKKFSAMKLMADIDDHRIRQILVYHGASTGRWAGCGIQIQNFTRGTFKFKSKKNPNAPELEYVIQIVKNRDYDSLRELGDVVEILSSMLRPMLIAAAGKKFIAADYSSIEARGLLWLVGDESGLNVFRVGGDIYVDMAATIYGVSASEVTDDQRFVGKQAILGLGYNMGWEKFIAQCAGYGVSISVELAKQVISAYRTKYILVKEFWTSVEDAAIAAVQTHQPVRCGRVTFKMDKDFLRCYLPSGRYISFYKPHFVPGKFDPNKLALAYMGTNSQKGNKFESTSTYGGKLTENIVQAIAADVLRCAVITLESNHIPIVLSVHDELVCEVPDTTQYNKQLIEQLMCVLPQWANGLPIAAEGWEGYRFKK